MDRYDPYTDKFVRDTIDKQAALKPFCITPDGTRIPEVDCDNFPVEFSVEFIKKHLLSLPSAEPKTMDKTNANKIYNYLKEQIGDTVDDMKEFDAWFKRMVWHVKECNRLTAEPRTDRDCTDFVRWLMDEVMDEENWQMNAVANGEIICRKLKKLGLLDVVDGYYVETQKTGAWIPVSERLPSQSGWYFVTVLGMERVSDMVWYYHESHEWNGVSETQKVLAWMPLPEPYKGGEEE